MVMQSQWDIALECRQCGSSGGAVIVRDETMWTAGTIGRHVASLSPGFAQIAGSAQWPGIRIGCTCCNRVIWPESLSAVAPILAPPRGIASGRVESASDQAPATRKAAS